MKLLLTTDGSQGATTAIVTASRLLKFGMADVRLVCVVPPWILAESGQPQTMSRLAYEHQIHMDAVDIIHETQAVLGNRGTRIAPVIKIGLPGELIVRAAMEGEYDVTVVGAYGRGEGSGPGLGSISSHVLDHAPGTVLIGRELVSEVDSGLSILAAIDGSAASERAVIKLAELFDLASTEITLLSVMETPWLRVGMEREERLDWANWERQLSDFGYEVQTALRRSADEALVRSRHILAGFGFGCRSLMREGNPAEEILRQAETDQYDLVVLGAKGLSDFKHSMLGSVSTYVTRHAPCSVAIVKAW